MRTAHNKLTQEQAISKMKAVWDKKDPGHYSYENFVYKGTDIKSFITCKYHGDFLMSCNNHTNHYHYQGCPKCAKQEKLTNESVDNKIKEQNRQNELERIGDVNGNKSPIDWRCLKCDRVWRARPNGVLRGTRCPICFKNFSKGEDLIIKWLKLNKIKYITQKRFKDCRNKRSLPFDFYLFELNVCIEFDGIHHFKKSYLKRIDSRFNIENFNKININDNIKNKYCKKNNIKLIRIPYWEKEKINYILKEKILV